MNILVKYTVAISSIPFLYFIYLFPFKFISFFKFLFFLSINQLFPLIFFLGCAWGGYFVLIEIVRGMDG